MYSSLRDVKPHRTTGVWETRSLRTRGEGWRGQAYQHELTGGWETVAYYTNMLVILYIEETRRGGSMSSHLLSAERMQLIQ